MLLSSYSKEVFRPECNHRFESVHCKACLSEDISAVLPYLNTVLGGTQFLSDPAELMFHHQGRIIKVGAREIAINALKDENEADRILEWLKSEINAAWENRHEIIPSFRGKNKPKLMDILRLLPRTNCKKCGKPTCMVFASLVAEGGRGATHCPELADNDRARLEGYLAGFDFE